MYFSNIFYYIIYPLYVSAPYVHPQVEYILDNNRLIKTFEKYSCD
jgi:hypothetical protein